MKTRITVMAFLGCTLLSGQSLGTEPESLTDQVKIAPPPFHGPVSDLPIVKIYPVTRESCEGWVRLGFEDKQDIYNGGIEVLDSKSPGKYDEEAKNSLLKLLSTQVPIPTPGPWHKLKVSVDESGQQRSVYTYTIGCDKLKVMGNEPGQ